MIADVVIAGGGFAGLALALALRQGLGPSFRIVVADPAFAADARVDPRASAIAAAARRMFETLDVWDAVADEAQPILDMVVTDSKLEHAGAAGVSHICRARSNRVSRLPT
jgi:2-octaprenyl-6-methoxyphenol hydroxylase